MPLPTLSLQPIIFGKRYPLDANIDLILDRLKEYGYEAIEGGCKDAAAMKQKLDARGLKFSASHVSLSSKPDPKKLFDYLHTVAGKDLCNSGLTTWDHPTVEDYRESIKLLNDLAKQCQAEGIHFHYHNHAFEFEKVDGNRTGMDLLLAGLDFSLMGLCMDVAWIYRGGSDPATFLTQQAEKITYLHFKDTDGTNWKPLGEGKVDFASVMKVLPTLKRVRWVAVEQDNTEEDPFDCVRRSREYLRRTFGY
jgi:sugar phosphate isomerase/epimerase